MISRYHKFDPFYVTGLFLHPLKTSENLWFLMFPGGIKETSGFIRVILGIHYSNCVKFNLQLLYFVSNESPLHGLLCALGIIVDQLFPENILEEAFPIVSFCILFCAE